MMVPDAVPKYGINYEAKCPLPSNGNNGMTKYMG